MLTSYDQSHTNHTAAMRPKEVSDLLQLDKIAKDHVWKVEPSCATTGEGIFEGLVSTIYTPYNTHPANMKPQAWLSNNVKLPAGSK
jgi:ADP-ribosylation factor protein 6